MKDKSTATWTKWAFEAERREREETTASNDSAKTVMQTSHADEAERSRSHLWFYKTDHDGVEVDNMDDVHALLLFWSTRLKHNQQ